MAEELRNQIDHLATKCDSRKKQNEILKLALRYIIRDYERNISGQNILMAKAMARATEAYNNGERETQIR